MDGVGHRSSLRHQLGAIRQRLIGLADEPTDDDDLRLRKRVGVVAGYINALAAVPLPTPNGWTAITFCGNTFYYLLTAR